MPKSLTKSIIIASDHAGFLMKEKVKIFLNKSKIKSLDLGSNENSLWRPSKIY